MSELDQSIERTGNLIKAAGGLLAFFPLLAIIFEVVIIPDDLESMAKLISFFVTIVGIFAIMFNQRWITSLKPRKATLLAVALVLIGTGCAVAYWVFAKQQLVTIVHPKEGETEEWREQVFIPLNPSAKIIEIVEAHGGDYAEALATGNDSRLLARLMQREQTSALLLTLGLMVLANILLVLGVVGAAWKLATGPGGIERPANHLSS